jgi:hypothetical protein
VRETPSLIENFNSPYLRARAIVGGLAHERPSSYAEARDRVLLTLLALNLMLLAFFAALNSSATFDKARLKAVGTSLLSSAAREEQAAAAENTQRVAFATLRTAVADAFAAFLPANQIPVEHPNTDRVEVDVPAQAFLESEISPELRVVLDRVAAIIAVPPPGYAAELYIRGSSEDGVENRLATLAQDIVRRGVTPTQLSIGFLNPGEASEPILRFTFVLLAANDTGIARVLSDAKGAGR